MRAVKTSLILAATIAALQACGHPAIPAAAAPPVSAAMRTASEADRDRANQLVWDKFTAEGVNVGIVKLQDTDKPRVYSYVCDYDRDFPNEFCFYTAKGQVNLETTEVTLTSRRRESCHPFNARAK